jgi:hypothetical protein
MNNARKLRPLIDKVLFKLIDSILYFDLKTNKSSFGIITLEEGVDLSQEFKRWMMTTN